MKFFERMDAGDGAMPLARQRDHGDWERYHRLKREWYFDHQAQSEVRHTSDWVQITEEEAQAQSRWKRKMCSGPLL